MYTVSKLIGAAALALLLAAPAEAGRHHITGRVIDRNGEPVDRAIISLEPGNVQLVTDRDGNFLVDYLRADDGSRIKLAKRTDYTIEIFKPGFHTHQESLYYKRGPVELKTVQMVADTLEIRDDGENLDPEIYQDPTHSAGANYEGQ